MSRAIDWGWRAAGAVLGRTEAWFPGRQAQLSSHDRQCWASAQTMGDLGDLVVAWLEGEIEETPGHGGPPCEETIPLIPALTLANRAGFVTDNSQLAESWNGHTWITWVSGFATDEILARLCDAVQGTALDLGACRGRQHGCKRVRSYSPRFCPWKDSVGFWADCCPDVAGELEDCWYVTIEDPLPGRNDVLWPALERFAGRAS